jgi:hypothetical protein
VDSLKTKFWNFERLRCKCSSFLSRTHLVCKLYCNEIHNSVPQLVYITTLAHFQEKSMWIVSLMWQICIHLNYDHTENSKGTWTQKKKQEIFQYVCVCHNFTTLILVKYPFIKLLHVRWVFYTKMYLYEIGNIKEYLWTLNSSKSENFKSSSI